MMHDALFVGVAILAVAGLVTGVLVWLFGDVTA